MKKYIFIDHYQNWKIDIGRLARAGLKWKKLTDVVKIPLCGLRAGAGEEGRQAQPRYPCNVQSPPLAGRQDDTAALAESLTDQTLQI